MLCGILNSLHECACLYNKTGKVIKKEGQSLSFIRFCLVFRAICAIFASDYHQKVTI